MDNDKEKYYIYRNNKEVNIKKAHYAVFYDLVMSIKKENIKSFCCYFRINYDELKRRQERTNFLEHHIIMLELMDSGKATLKEIEEYIQEKDEDYSSVLDNYSIEWQEQFKSVLENEYKMVGDYHNLEYKFSKEYLQPYDYCNIASHCGRPLGVYIDKDGINFKMFFDSLYLVEITSFIWMLKELGYKKAAVMVEEEVKKNDLKENHYPWKY